MVVTVAILSHSSSLPRSVRSKLYRELMNGRSAWEVMMRKWKWWLAFNLAFIVLFDARLLFYILNVPPSVRRNLGSIPLILFSHAVELALVLGVLTLGLVMFARSLDVRSKPAAGRLVSFLGGVALIGCTWLLFPLWVAFSFPQY